MPQSILIVGAGIIGATTALHLARAGCDVTVISAGEGAATSASFGWINASFYLDDDHHRLRVAGMTAWQRLCDTLEMPVRWPGCLCWDMPDDALSQTQAELTEHGYPVEVLTREQIAAKEPALVTPPDRALFFPTEGAVELPGLSQRLMDAACAAGARHIRDTTVTGVLRRGGACVGVETTVGPLFADDVVLAAGTGTMALTADTDRPVPMVPRPAYILRTAPQSQRLRHILASPIGEVRQEASGAFLMPVAVSHQCDQSETLMTPPDAAADEAMVRLRGLLHGLEDLSWSQITRADRPVPADGRPAIGPLGKGLYAATLHSGITLGPLVGEMVAREVTRGPDNATAAMLAPYRPDRFANA